MREGFSEEMLFDLRLTGKMIPIIPKAARGLRPEHNEKGEERVAGHVLEVGKDQITEPRGGDRPV